MEEKLLKSIFVYSAQFTMNTVKNVSKMMLVKIEPPIHSLIWLKFVNIKSKKMKILCIQTKIVEAPSFPVDIFSPPPIVSSIQRGYVSRNMSREDYKYWIQNPTKGEHWSIVWHVIKWHRNGRKGHLHWNVPSWIWMDFAFPINCNAE